MAKKVKKPFEFKSFESITKTATYIRITKNMMDSPAWKNLSAYAVDLYLNLKYKYNSHNEDDISFTYAEGTKLMSKVRFTKAIDELINMGFIKLMRQSWTSREPNIYGLSSMWQKYGTPGFKVQPRRKRSSIKQKG